MCLAVLVLITLVNLHGVRESGVAFVLPTYLFVATLGLVIVIGLAKLIMAGGHPARPRLRRPCCYTAIREL